MGGGGVYYKSLNFIENHAQNKETKYVEVLLQRQRHYMYSSGGTLSSLWRKQLPKTLLNVSQ